MSRRIGAAIVTTTVITMILTGIGTLLLTRAEAFRTAQDDLEDQAGALATVFSTVPTFDPNDDSLRDRLARFRQQLQLDGADLLVVRNGELVTDLPGELTIEDLDLPAGPARVSSGRKGEVVYATARLAGQPDAAAGLGFYVLVTDRAGELLTPALRWFILSAAVSVGIGLGVAFVLARRLRTPSGQRPMPHAGSRPATSRRESSRPQRPSSSATWPTRSTTWRRLSPAPKGSSSSSSYRCLTTSARH